MPPLTRESVVQCSPVAVAAEVADEIVLMNLPRGRCYGLGPVGTDIWKRLHAPILIQQLIADLSAEYAAEPGILDADVLETLEQYATEGLIEVLIE